MKDATPEHERLSAAAERFRASGSLGKPGTLSRLFDFLLARTLAGEAPKEIEIALAVFGKSPTFDVSQDAVVRVYVHKLRRRLDDFFSKDTQAAAGRLTIPKGEYRIAFEAAAVAVHVDQSPVLIARARTRWLAPAAMLVAGLLIGALLTFAAMRLGGDRELREVQASSVWAPLFDDDLPITLVVGDYYLLGEMDQNGNVQRLVREFFINSERDFLDHAELAPELMQKYRNLKLTYLPTASAFAVQDVAALLGREKRVSVTLMSTFDVNLLKTSHVIYIGFISGLGVLGDPVFAASRVSPGGSFDELVDQRTKTTYISTAMPQHGGDASFRDYGYFSTFAGPVDNRIMIIAGTRDTGVRQTAEALTHSSSLDELATRTQAAPAFESLYEIYGVAHASINSKLVFASPMRNVNVWDAR